MIVIGISGKIGSGKDTVAYQIIENFKEKKFKNKKFAFYVKKIVSMMTGISINDIFNRDIKEKYLDDWGMTVGEMFQIFGTDAVRDNLHINAWILTLFANSKNENIVISDVRFKNEADFVKEKGGILIRLEGDPKKLRQHETRNLLHESETDLDDYEGFDIIWKNKPPISNLKHLMKLIEDKIDEKY